MRIAVAGGTGMVGRYVVQVARELGHDVVVLARSAGIDLRNSSTDIGPALAGVEVIIDTTNPGTVNKARATSFFTDVTRRIHAAGSEAGVSRLVTLSIFGVDRVPGYGYFRAKLAHEEAALAGPIPATIVRATQFHEFPVQILTRTRIGRLAVVPVMRVQPIAARSVGQVLVEVAVGAPSSTAVQIAGPEPEDLVVMARALVRRHKPAVRILALPVPGAAGKAMRDGTLLPAPAVRTVGPSFTGWLATKDARSSQL